jgi:hypothetical protein
MPALAEFAVLARHKPLRSLVPGSASLIVIC